MDGKSFTLTGDFRDRRSSEGRKVSLAPDFETFATAVAFDKPFRTRTTVTIVGDDVLPASLTGLAIGTPIVPAIDFKFENLEELVSFDNLDFSFASIIDAPLMVRDLLSQFEGIGRVVHADPAGGRQHQRPAGLCRQVL